MQQWGRYAAFENNEFIESGDEAFSDQEEEQLINNGFASSDEGPDAGVGTIASLESGHVGMESLSVLRLKDQSLRSARQLKTRTNKRFYANFPEFVDRVESSIVYNSSLTLVQKFVILGVPCY